MVSYSEQLRDLSQWGPGRWDEGTDLDLLELGWFSLYRIDDNLVTGEVWVSAHQLEPMHGGRVGPATFLSASVEHSIVKHRVV